MQKINQKRKKVHREYVFLRACQKHEKYSDDYMAAYLGCSSRTYRDKLLGWNDFSPLEARALSSLFSEVKNLSFAFYHLLLCRSTHLYYHLFVSLSTQKSQFFQKMC